MDLISSPVVVCLVQWKIKRAEFPQYILRAVKVGRGHEESGGELW